MGRKTKQLSARKWLKFSSFGSNHFKITKTERFLKPLFVFLSSKVVTFFKMHVTQPKHTKLGPKETKELLEKYNINLTQLPKISIKDAALPEDCETGDVIKIERKDEIYFRVVI